MFLAGSGPALGTAIIISNVAEPIGSGTRHGGRVRELTSSFDDIEKRMAIFIGIGAFLFSSLMCLVRGSSFETYVIQGSLAALVFMVAGYFYGHWLRGLVKEHGPTENSDEENVEFRTVDAEHISEEVVTSGEFPDTVIEEGGTVIPSDAATSFEMPELPGDMAAPAPEPAPAPAPPAPAPITPAPPAPRPQADLGEDLPPPPVPSGA